MRVLFWNTFLLQVRLGPVFVHRKPLVKRSLFGHPEPSDDVIMDGPAR